MKNSNKFFRLLGKRAGFLLLIALVMGLGLIAPAYADSLYIGDQGDNTVKQFDADTGAFQGLFVKKGNSPIKGPRGLVFDGSGDLLLSNQNVNTGRSGSILEFDRATGNYLGALVPFQSNPDAPVVPRGMVLSGGFLFVADITTESNANKPPTPGRLLKYTRTGELVAAITPPDPSLFHPRGVVVGPDGLLYVSNATNLPLPPAIGQGGQVLRFNPDGSFVDVFIDDITGGVGQLNRPEGLVFSPDGTELYVTSFRASVSDTDSIRIYDASGGFQTKIDLDVVGQARTYAQAILFGPQGCLFVPINTTGEVRRYNVGGSCSAASPYETFVAAGGDLKLSWYLSFGSTRPDTLQYP